MSTYLVTGGGRGLGFGFVAELAKRDGVSKVIAATRSQPPAALADLINKSSGKVVNILCDVSSQQSVDASISPISEALGGSGLDVLVNVVGSQEPTFDGIANMTDENLTSIFDVNVLTAHRMTRALMPLLRKGNGKKVVNISSTVGSISMSKGFHLAPQPSYKVTKAALNMLTVQYALDYEKEGFTFVSLSPGWVRTDLTEKAGGGGHLDIETSSRAVIDQIEGAGPQKNGHFLNIHVPGYENQEWPNAYDGKSPPW